MTNITTENRSIAKHVAAAFGGSPRVTRYWDEARESFVDLLVAEDRPQPGLNSFSTVGLSDHPLMRDGREFEARVEFVGACGAAFKHFDNIITTAAFCVINSNWFCYPGAIFPDVVKMYNASETMRHLLFVSPFLWEGRLEPLVFPTKRIAWLLIVPISEAEKDYADEHGADELEKRFMESQIDVFDLWRPSVI